MAKRADLVGQRFGRLVVEEYAFTKNKRAYWKCKCDCGTFKNIPTGALRNGETQSCGCLRKEVSSRTRSKDISGQRFGMLVAVNYEYTDNSRNRHWKCICDCGKITYPSAGSLLQGNTTSCGCKRIENANAANNARRTYAGEYINGHTRLYNIWHGMCQRCHDPNSTGYANYGAKGIIVCKEWRENPLIFQKWALENGYTDDLSIDRIDFNGNYEPSNCRWVTREVQDNNKRTNVFLDYNGKHMTIAQWARELNISYSVIQHRIKAGWTVEDALTKPSMRRIKKSN